MSMETHPSSLSSAAPAPAADHAPRHQQLGLSDAQVLAALAGMQRARAVDDRLWQLSRQGKAHFVITSAGHEAIQFGCGWAIRPGHDYTVPYYRDMALALALGQTPLDLLLHGMGKPTDPASGGRQMFGHFSTRRLRLVSGSSSVGSHIVHAVGLALAFRITGEQDIAAITFFGEGATSEGAWHEGISVAGVHQLPIVFVCENNGYAISVPARREVPVPDVATKAAGYGMPGIIADGTDIFAVYEVAHAAMQRARSGAGPTLLEFKTQRLRPHSNADDHAKYRPAEEIAALAQHDPIRKLCAYAIQHGLLDAAGWEQMQREIRAEVDEATFAADNVPDPPLESLYDHLYGTAPEGA